jgi:hypothetical protein
MTTQNFPDYSQFQELVTDADFIKLRQLTSKFNIFEVMRATHTEIRHSNILAWLLYPYGNHGCGDAFLRQLLLTVSQKQGKHGLSFYDFYMLEIESVTIEREWVPRKKTRKALNEEFDHQDDRSKKNMDRLDILIDIELKGQIKCDKSDVSYSRLVIPIENKIRSKEAVKENGTQLQGYSDALADVFDKDVKIVPVFLTPDGSDPTASEWIKLDYEETRKIISTVYNNYKEDLSEDKKLMIEQYLDLLQNHIVSGFDPEVVRLCRAIQKNHMPVMDEIRKLTTPSNKTEDAKHKLSQQIVNRNESVFTAYKKWQFGLREKISDLLITWMDSHQESHGFRINSSKKSSLEFVSPEMQELSKNLFGKDNGLVLFFDNGLNSRLRIIMQINHHENQELRKSVYGVFQRDKSELFRPTDTEKISQTYTRIHAKKLCTPDEAIKKSSDKEVLDSVLMELEEYFSPNGTYLRIQKFLRDHMREFLALKK